MHSNIQKLPACLLSPQADGADGVVLWVSSCPQQAFPMGSIWIWPKIHKNFKSCLHENLLDFLPSKHKAEFLVIASNNSASSLCTFLTTNTSKLTMKWWRQLLWSPPVTEWSWPTKMMHQFTCMWLSVSSSKTIIPLKWLCKMKAGCRISWKVITWLFPCSLSFMSYRFK